MRPDTQRSFIAAGLTILLHGVFFIALGFLLARAANKPLEPLSISIEFAEVEQGDSFEEFFSGEQLGQDSEAQEEEQEIVPDPEPEVEPEPEPEPPLPEPEPILTQPEPAPTLPEPEMMEEPEPTIPVDDNQMPSTPIDDDLRLPPTPTDSASSSQASQAPQPSLSSQNPDVSPSARNVIKPVYPLDARRRGEEGLVIHDITISEKGVVMAAELVTSSGYPELDRAARKAIMAARFSTGGKSHVLRLPIEFKLVDR